MNELDNPASRLLGLLESGNGISRPRNTQIRDAWRQLLDVDAGDEVTLLRRIGLVYAIPQAIRDDVQALPDDNHDLLLKPLEAIGNALALPLQDAWSTFLHTIDDTSRYGLAIVEDRLKRSSRYVALDGDKLAEMRERLAGFLEECLAEDLPADLRRVLVRHAQRMIAAIDEVRLRGAGALQEAGEAAWGGAMFADVSGAVGSKDDPAAAAKHSKLVKLVAFATGLLVLINTAQAGFALEGIVDQRLFGGPKELGTGEPPPE